MNIKLPEIKVNLPAAKKVKYINLLRHQEKSAIDKFLDWAFTVGRAIVIITESVALGAFAYRFVLDRQIIDLKDKIKQEQAIIKLSEVNEQKFRTLQARLAIEKTLDEASVTKTTILKNIVSAARGRMSFRTIDISEAAISMEGITPSANAVSSFANQLKGLPGITKVSIGQLTNDTARGVLSVGLQAEFAAAKPPAPAEQPTPNGVSP